MQSLQFKFIATTIKEQYNLTKSKNIDPIRVLMGIFYGMRMVRFHSMHIFEDIARWHLLGEINFLSLES